MLHDLFTTLARTDAYPLGRIFIIIQIIFDTTFIIWLLIR